MPHTAIEPSCSSRLTPSGRASNQSPRPRDWSGLTDRDILARYEPGRADPMQVLEVLLKLHNQEHTARMKTVVGASGLRGGAPLATRKASDSSIR